MSSGRAGLYLRLSKEDRERNTVSESIENQRSYLLQAAEDRGLLVKKIYEDDGYSGTNFDRPAFLRMLQDIEAGTIDTVLVKDLSRLGRDYILTGHYIERYFPEHGVRFIAVNDGVDTSDSLYGNEMTPFMAVVNDLYAKDISKKVRTALTVKKKQGRFIGAKAPYGYIKSKEDHNQLLPDPKRADTVRLIFSLAAERHSLTAISEELYRRKIPPPMGDGEKRWSTATLKNILMNPTYVGHLTQNKSKKVNYKLKKKQALPREQWIVVEDTHEALVSETLFKKALAALEGSARRKPEKNPSHLLSGLLFCKDCGSGMTLLKSGRYRYFVCGGWKRGLCETSHSVRADWVTEEVVKRTEDELDRLSPEEVRQEILRQRNIMVKEEQEALRMALEEAEEKKAVLYEDKLKGLLSEETYGRVLHKLLLEEERLRQYLPSIPPPPRYRRPKTDSLLMKLLIERVEVGKQHHLTIRFRFRKKAECDIIN